MKNILLSLIITIISFLLSVFNDHLRAQTVFTQNFEGVIPSGWTQQMISGSNGWSVGNSATFDTTSTAGEYFNVPSFGEFACTTENKCNCDKDNDMLITPSINMSSYTHLQLSYDEFFMGLANGAETASIKSSTDGGNTWQSLAKIQPYGSWVTQFVDLSSLCGKNSVKLAFVYDNGGVYLNGTNPKVYVGGLAIDSINIYMPYNYDVTGVSLNITGCFSESVQTINGWVQNRGGIEITSMIMNYQIDNNPIVSDTLNNLAIPSAYYYNYSFSTTWNANILGTHLIKMWTSKVNGNSNQDTLSTDTLETNVNIYKTGKPVLVEYFTSASCYYCGLYDPNLQSTVAQNEDFVMALAYHLGPFDGNPDPLDNSYNSGDFTTRFNFYDITGIPTAFTDGTKNDDLLDEANYECGLRSATEQDTVFEIENPMAKLTGNTLTYSADVVAEKNISGSIYGYVAVIEKEIDFRTAPGTNGQTQFPWVMRKMCPNGNGTALPSTMNAGDKETLSGSWTLADIYNKSELRVIFFIQNGPTKEVYWAAMMNPTEGITENHNLSIEKIYPNPTKDETKIYFSLTKPENVSLRLYDMVGKEILTKDLGLVSTGQNIFTLDVNSLNTGMYFIELISDNEQAVWKINVIK